MRGATKIKRQHWKVVWISTHTPHAGRDKNKKTALESGMNFYSHAPCGARPIRDMVYQDRGEFLLTRPMRGATQQTFWGSPESGISTHTPHAGRDEILADLDDDGWDFYSHAPCGARQDDRTGSAGDHDFYSHAPCGARQNVSKYKSSIIDFYSHAPCGARRFWWIIH